MHRKAPINNSCLSSAATQELTKEPEPSQPTEAQSPQTTMCACTGPGQTTHGRMQQVASLSCPGVLQSFLQVLLPCPGRHRFASQKLPQWIRGSRLKCGKARLLQTPGLHLPPFPKQTAGVELAHLIGQPSIVGSSNPHKLTIQGEREAAPAGMHGAQAMCGPGGAPQGRGGPHKGLYALIPAQSAASPLTSLRPLTPAVGRRLPHRMPYTLTSRSRPWAAFRAHRCPPFRPSLARRRPP